MGHDSATHVNVLALLSSSEKIEPVAKSKAILQRVRGAFDFVIPIALAPNVDRNALSHVRGTFDDVLYPVRIRFLVREVTPACREIENQCSQQAQLIRRKRNF